MVRKPIYIISTAFFAASFFLLQTILFAQNPPPEGVARIFNDTVLLEKHFEKQDWDEARAVANRIDNEILNIMVAAQLDDLILEKSLTGLKAALYEERLPKTEGKYIFFQKRLFTFLNNFSYEVHPVLAMIELSVNAESSAALKNQDYQDIANEMAEAGNLINVAKPLLLEKGIRDEELVKFSKMIVALIKSIKRNEFNQVDEQLQEIQKLYISFMERAI